MLLIDPITAAKALGISCGVGREAASAADDLSVPLNIMLPRIEDALDVASLPRAQFSDTFTVGGRGYDGFHALRLANGFLVQGVDTPLVVTEVASAAVIDPADLIVDDNYGIVRIPSYRCGMYRVDYYAGFEAIATEADGVPIPLDKQVLNVPTWLQTIAIHVLNEWFRSVPRTVAIKEGISFAAINTQSNRAMQHAIWGRYLRPRAEVVWTLKSQRISD